MGGGGDYIPIATPPEYSCIKMGSDESHFNVSLIVRDKVTRQRPQTTTFEEKGEPKRIRTEVRPQLTSLTRREEDEEEDEEEEEVGAIIRHAVWRQPWIRRYHATRLLTTAGAGRTRLTSFTGNTCMQAGTVPPSHLPTCLCFSGVSSAARTLFG